MSFSKEKGWLLNFRKEKPRLFSTGAFHWTTAVCYDFFFSECPVTNPNTKRTRTTAPAARIVSPKTLVHFRAVMVGE
jgi:hypothetical protein